MSLEYSEDLAGQRDNKIPVRAEDLQKETLKAGTEVTVYAEQVAQDETLWFGAGSDTRRFAEAFIFADLVATGDGAAASAGDPIDGDLVAAITDSRQKRVLASTTIDSIGELRDAVDDPRTERPTLGALAPFANPGRHIEWRIDAADASDGYEIDPAESSARLYYSQKS